MFIIKAHFTDQGLEPDLSISPLFSDLSVTRYENTSNVIDKNQHILSKPHREKHKHHVLTDQRKSIAIASKLLLTTILFYLS